jgi:hypothetical protein
MNLPTVQLNDESNLLKLKHASSEYRCIIYAYSVSHEVLSIQVTHVGTGVEENFFLTFSAVVYLCGNLKWDEAVLRLNRSDEHIKLVKNCFEGHIDVLNSDPSVLEDLVNLYKLYEFVAGDSKTQILAGGIPYIADHPHTQPITPLPQPPTDPVS